MLDRSSLLLGPLGCALLGLYFLVPGLAKVLDFEGTAQVMRDAGMFWVQPFLILTIVLQVGLGALLIAGRYLRVSAMILAAVTLAINVVIHDFWTLPPGLEQAHETQNFIKNLAIMAGLMVLAAAEPDRNTRDSSA